MGIKALGIEILIRFGIIAIINAVWIALEIWFDGGQSPSWADTVMTVILTESIYKNLKIRIFVSE